MKKIFVLLLMIASMDSFAFQKQLSPREAQEAAAMENARRNANRASEGHVHAPRKNMAQEINTMAGMIKQKAKKACFKEGTLILSADEGADCKAIEDVEVGDQVLSFDEASGEIVARRVEAIFRVYTDTLVEITFENGRVVETTEDHPFNSSESKDWIAAGELQVGGFVSTNKGALQIASLTIRELDEPLLVYDLSVESTHNYFVVGNGQCADDESGVLVHNCDGVGAINEAYRNDPNKGIPEQVVYHGVTQPIEQACNLGKDICDGNLGNLATAAAGVYVGVKGAKTGSPSAGISGFNPKVFAEQISKLSPGERVAKVIDKAKEIAKQHGWSKNSKLSKQNGRTVFTSKDGTHYSVDTQHGGFEKIGKNGKHEGQFDFTLKQNKPSDPSGQHDLNVK